MLVKYLFIDNYLNSMGAQDEENIGISDDRYRTQYNPGFRPEGVGRWPG